MESELMLKLDEIFENNTIDEVGVTLDPSLPSLFYIEGKLGIASTVLKSLFQYAVSELYCLEKAVTKEQARHIISVTRAILLIKGDFPTAFNCRKSVIEQGLGDVWAEIKFTALLFTQHAKCPSGWQHRRWCLQYSHMLRLESRIAHVTSFTLSPGEVETERELCREMTDKHPKNYYAWVHRLWLLQFMSIYQV
jgi:protein prenyltransferase alpha subunit repeat containing protein 1